MNYRRWLEIIKVLGCRRPVVVIGNSSLRLPHLDISAGEFNQQLANIGGGVFNAIDSTSLRVVMALIARSAGVISLDSSPLYIAQAFNTPAISIWGTHAPASRIGYDKNYMDLAIWKQNACLNSPCFSYGEFPVNKCPDGKYQTSCAVTADVSVDDVLRKVDMLESSMVKA
jgi:ADP-heptose:LPS heptosyltransferase